MIILQKKTEKSNSNWPQIIDQPYKTSIIGGFTSGKQTHYNNKTMRIVMLLMKFIYLLRIQMKQNTNILFKNTKNWS